MNNREFLFLYDAANCNPNGDPDQENKPRMDRATKTNLVSSYRLKRYVRDYLIDNETNEKLDVFVRQMGERKVSLETRLTGEINKLKTDEKEFDELVKENEEFKKLLDQFKSNVKSVSGLSYFEIFLLDGEDKIKSNITGSAKPEKDARSEEENFIKSHKGFINNAVLTALVKSKFIDIRFFGGSFAAKGFSRTFTGAVQVNLGYSLHPVELNTSNSLVTIMPAKSTDDGNSTIGKNETLFYSLIGFSGTVNAKKAEINGLKDTDLPLFRQSLIKSILETRTESKKNQYPRFYLEIEYNGELKTDGKKTPKETYGRLGDLRNHVKLSSKAVGRTDDDDFTKARNLEDINIDFNLLFKKIKLIKDKIKCIKIWTSLDFDFEIIKNQLTKQEEVPDSNKQSKNTEGIAESKIEQLTI